MEKENCHLHLTFKGEDVLDTAVKELLAAKVREMVRTNLQQIVAEVAKEEVERLFNNERYRNELKQAVKNGISERIAVESYAFKTHEIRKMVEVQMENRVSDMMDNYAQKLDAMCKDTVDKIVTDTVRAKFAGLLNA